MTKDNPQAAGQGGHEPFSAARTPPPEGRPPGFVFPGFAARDNALESDDDFRRFAASRLADQLDLGVSLIAISEHLASLPGEDRVRPLYAAARLMNSNASLGRALAQLAQAERRQRTIVEPPQSSRPFLSDSNSVLSNAMEDELRLKMLRYMKLLTAETLDPALAKAAAEKDAAPDLDGAPE